MTWTYDVDELATSSLMQLRLMIGDINADNPLAQDEELEYWIASEGGVRPAAIAALEALAATYSTKADRTIGPLSIKYSQISAQLCSRAQGLRIDRLALSAEPYAGGIDTTEKRINEQDRSRVQPFFTRRRFESYTGDDDGSKSLSPWHENG